MVEILAQADPDKLRNDFRRAALKNDVKTLKNLAETIYVANQTPATLMALAGTLKNLREEAAAIDLLTLAQHHHPADFWIAQKLGNSLTRPDSNRLGEAVACNRIALAFRPRNPGILNNLGNALWLQNNVPDAMDAYRRAIHINPEYAAAYYNLGRALFDQDLPAAKLAFQKAIQINPEVAEFHVLTAHFNLGVALERQGNYPAAMEQYRKLIAIDANHEWAHNNLGMLLGKQGDLTAATGHFRRAIEIKPDNSMAHNNLGLAIFYLRDSSISKGPKYVQSCRAKAKKPRISPQRELRVSSCWFVISCSAG